MSRVHTHFIHTASVLEKAQEGATLQTAAPDLHIDPGAEHGGAGAPSEV